MGGGESILAGKGDSVNSYLTLGTFVGANLMERIRSLK